MDEKGERASESLNTGLSGSIVHIAAFDPKAAVRHGGVRRTEQLVSLVGADKLLFIPSPLSVPKRRRTFYILRGVFKVRGALTWQGLLRAAFAVGYLEERFHQLRVDPDKSRFFLEMCHGLNLHIGSWLVRRGCHVHVAAHNVEFLVQGQSNRDCREGGDFRLERELYRHAKSVICIGDVDRFLVECLGATARVVPYFPAPEDVDRFQAISDTRLSGPKKSRLLYIGTTHNPPTRAGLYDLIRQFEESFGEEWTLTIAGFGTDELVLPADISRISIRGPITDHELDALLCEVAGVLVFQPPTTGFLTRLVEMNLSGVPVFINRSYIPARGLEEYGIRTYQELGEVSDLISLNAGEKFNKFAKPLAELFDCG